MKSLFTCLLFVFLSPFVSAQDSTYVPAKPPISVARMMIYYYDIKWTDEQWAALTGQSIELFYLIDEVGEPFLQASRGLPDQVYRDSMDIATGRMPYFTPAYRDGIAEESVYSIQFSFPAYRQDTSGTPIFFNLFQAVSPDELATDYKRDFNAIFLDFNLNYINHLGRPDAYLHGGGGFDMFIGGRFADQWSAALAVGTEFTGKKQPFPDDPIPDRDDQATGVWIGGLINRDLRSTDQSILSLRGELAYGALNAANRVDPDEDEGWVQYRGVHTGISVNYALRFSKYTPNPGIMGDVVTARYSAINFNAGLRYRYYGDKEGTGAFWFIGVGYRLGRDDFSKR